jgi:hypothetical protein
MEEPFLGSAIGVFVFCRFQRSRFVAGNADELAAGLPDTVLALPPTVLPAKKDNGTTKKFAAVLIKGRFFCQAAAAS